MQGLSENIRAKVKVTNTLAYCGTELITAWKSYVTLGRGDILMSLLRV
jgi:hypothetical protein